MNKTPRTNKQEQTHQDTKQTQIGTTEEQVPENTQTHHQRKEHITRIKEISKAKQKQGKTQKCQTRQQTKPT